VSQGAGEEQDAEQETAAMSSTVKDVMSTHVIAVRRNASYKDMAAMLHEQRVSAFPVLDDHNKVIGVVSESDLLTKEALGGTVSGMLQSMVSQREHARAGAVTAAELMTTPPVTIGPDESVTQAARVMYSRRLKRLPVTSDDGTLIGIVTRTDVLRVYSRPDADIQHEIIQDLILGTFRCDPARFAVTVTDGVVTIEGAPETDLAGRDIIDAVRHVEGVVAVRDQLSHPQET
jgi:CBS domain-containing protein